MNYTKALSTIKDLLKRVEDRRIKYIVYLPKFDSKTHSITMGGTNLSFQGKENATSFLNAVDELWRANKVVFEAYTKETFEDELVKFMQNFKNGEECSLEHLKKFYQTFTSKKTIKFEALYPVYGAEYYKDHPLKIGPYTIYNTNIHREQILNKYPFISKNVESEYDKFAEISNVVISVHVEAGESEKADEKALIRLQQFENTIQFIIADYMDRTEQINNYDIGVFNFHETKRTHGLLLSNQLSVSINSLTNTPDMAPLHEIPINDPDYGYDLLWDMLEKENLTELENRIMSGITWIGKGLRDKESTRVLVQYVFALEALLQFQQKDSMVSPSITYKMAELSAFIIGEEYEDRSEIEKMVKLVYGKRSAIAHGGSHEVDELIIYKALWLIRNLIMILVVNEELKDSKTIQEVDKWVKKQKYSS
ncbi:hypothetical protein [Priestia megaterium]|uniref:hypothetical protein n=1 Tax=Priestia megaterium TaxID=1404 RepID=UPI002E22AB13|nr:HEPN domain-containing protein [Priestia megaterium]